MKKGMKCVFIGGAILASSSITKANSDRTVTVTSAIAERLLVGYSTDKIQNMVENGIVSINPEQNLVTIQVQRLNAHISDNQDRDLLDLAKNLKDLIGDDGQISAPNIEHMTLSTQDRM